MEDDKERTLFCANIHEKVTEDLLYELFLQAGPLESVTIPKRDGQQRNFAFIKFKHAVSVQYTIALMDGVKLFGKQLRLQEISGCNKGLNPYLEKLRQYRESVSQQFHYMNDDRQDHPSTSMQQDTRPRYNFERHSPGRDTNQLEMDADEFRECVTNAGKNTSQFQSRESAARIENDVSHSYSKECEAKASNCKKRWLGSSRYEARKETDARSLDPKMHEPRIETRARSFDSRMYEPRTETNARNSDSNMPEAGRSDASDFDYKRYDTKMQSDTRVLGYKRYKAQEDSYVNSFGSTRYEERDASHYNSERYGSKKERDRNRFDSSRISKSWLN